MHKSRMMCTCKALVELAETDYVWAGCNPDERLRNAHVQFTKMCRQHKIRTSVEICHSIIAMPFFVNKM